MWMNDVDVEFLLIFDVKETYSYELLYTYKA